MIRSVIGLIVLFASSLTAQRCIPFDREIRPIHPNFGLSEGFYGFSKGISEGLQKTPDEETYQSLHKLVSGDESAGSVVQSMLLRQIGAIIFWSIGFLFILAAFGLCIGTCVWQCCSTCAPKEGSVRKKRTGCVYLLLVLLSFTTLLSGVVLFNLAQADLFESIDHMMDHTRGISTDLDEVLGKGKDQLTCEVNATTKSAFQTVKDVLNKYDTAVVDGTSARVGLTTVNSFNYSGFKDQNDRAQAAADELRDAVQSFLQFGNPSPECIDDGAAMHTEYTALGGILQALSDSATRVKSNSDLRNLNNQIAEIKRDIQTEAKKVSDSIRSTEKSIDDSIGSIKKMLEHVQKQITEFMKQLKSMHSGFMESSSYTITKLSILLAVTVPACIAAFFAIFTLVAIPLSLKKQDGIALKMAPGVFTAFNTAISSSIALILCASLTFVLGWIFSTVCLPVFQDPEYHLFHLMNHEIAASDPKKAPTVVNFGDFFEACSNPDTTIYTAINASNIISEASISEKMNVDDFRKQASDKIRNQKPREFNMEPQWEQNKNDLNEFFETSRGKNLQSCGEAKINELHSVYIKNLEISVKLANSFYDNLKRLNENAPKVKDIANELNNAQFDMVGVKAATSGLLKKLKTQVFKCRPFVDIFNNAGHVMCEQFGKPIHGLWAAAGMIGLSVFFLALLLLLTFKWLKKGNTPKNSDSMEKAQLASKSGEKKNKKREKKTSDEKTSDEKKSDEKLSGEKALDENKSAEKVPEELKSTEKVPEGNKSAEKAPEEQIPGEKAPEGPETDEKAPDEARKATESPGF